HLVSGIGSVDGGSPDAVIGGQPHHGEAFHLVVAQPVVHGHRRARRSGSRGGRGTIWSGDTILTANHIGLTKNTVKSGVAVIILALEELGFNKFGVEVLVQFSTWSAGNTVDGPGIFVVRLRIEMRARIDMPVARRRNDMIFLAALVYVFRNQCSRFRPAVYREGSAFAKVLLDVHDDQSVHGGYSFGFGVCTRSRQPGTLV